MFKCTTVLLECCTTCGRGGARGRRARFRPRSTVEKFKEDLAVHIRFRDGCVHHDGSEYDHLKGIRTYVDGVTTMESKRKYQDAVLELLGLEGAKDVPNAMCPCTQGTVREERLVGPGWDRRVPAVCWRVALLHAGQSRRAVWVSILGSMVGKPTACSMIALKRVARYLKGTRELVNELELDQEVDKHEVKLDGFSDSEWAGSNDWKSQPSGVLFIDGAPF